MNPLFWIALALVIILIIVILALTKSRHGGSKSFSETLPPPEGPETLEAAALDERDITLLDLISKKETTISGLAKKAGLSKSVVWRRIRKLSNLGLIHREDVGAKTLLKITDSGLKALTDRRSV